MFFLKEIHVTSSLCPLAAGQGEFLPEVHRQFFNIKNNSTLCFPGIQVSLCCWQSRSLNIQDIQILVKKERQRYSNAKFSVKEALREGSLPRNTHNPSTIFCPFIQCCFAILASSAESLTSSVVFHFIFSFSLISSSAIHLASLA